MAQFVTGMEADLLLTAGGPWTSITSYLYIRTQPSVTITRGRPDETSQVTPSQMTGQLNNRDGRFTSRNPSGPYYPDLTRNTPIRLSVPDSGTYLRTEDDAVSYVSCPDSSALRLTGSLSVLADVWPDNYMPCVIASKWGTTGQAWALTLNSDGTLTLWWYTGSVVASATSTQPVPHLGRMGIEASLNATTGLVTFYTSGAGYASPVQLGIPAGPGAATTVSSATGQVVCAANSPSFAETDPYGQAYQGYQGRMYSFYLLNSSAANVASPVFSSQAAGATSFTDGQSNTWTTEGTCELSNRSYRFHGEISSLPVSWDPSGRDIYVPFQASGILRRLAQGNANVLSPMRRAIMALDNVVAYWPCEDAAGSQQLASGLPGGTPMAFTAGITLADDSDFACSNPIPNVGASAWYGTVPAYTATGAIVYRFLLDLSASPALFTILTQLTTTGTMQTIQVIMGSSGSEMTATGASSGGTVATSTGILVPPSATGPCMISVEVTQSGGNVVLSLSLMLPDGSVYTPATGTVAGTVGELQAVAHNNNGGTIDGGLGHGFAQSSYQPLTTMQPALNAYAGETAGNRFIRLCQEYSIQPRVYGFPQQSVIMGAQGIDTLANLLQAVETADNGMLYEPSETFGVGYRTLAAVCSQAAGSLSPALTLSYASAQVGDQEGTPVSLASVDDDQYTRNDVTVTRATTGQDTGSSYQAQLAGGSAMSISAPPAGVGDYTNSVDVNVDSDAQLPDAAWWLVHVGTVQAERYPQIVTGLHRPVIVAAGLRYSIQDVRIGDYVEVTSTPAWLPPGPIRQIVAGVTESLSSYLYQVSWNAIPESPYDVMVAGDAVYGHVDTDGSTLGTSVSPTAASLSVATDAGFVIWTTRGSDFPFDIAMAGERITVTNITGTSSPQTFTVTRSVNGVVKSQSAGTAVSLWFPATAALTTALATAL